MVIMKQNRGNMKLNKLIKLFLCTNGLTTCVLLLGKRCRHVEIEGTNIRILNSLWRIAIYLPASWSKIIYYMLGCRSGILLANS